MSTLNVKKTKTYAEFFAGIGLMRLGLEYAGWKVIFANDIDPQKEEMYKDQFPNDSEHFVLGDIHSLNESDIPTVQLATASFPCNDLSLAGGRRGLEGKNSSAFWGFVDILAKLNGRKPPLILIENVPGFLTSNGGRDLKGALRALNELGYRVDVFMLDAAWFVPQSRLRLFIIGQKLVDQNPIISDSFLQSQARPEILAKFIFDNPDIDWQIRTLPEILPAQKTLTDCLENLSEEDPAWWSSERSDYLLNQMSARHRATAESWIKNKYWSYGTVFRRVRAGKSMAELRIDGVAGCLRTPRGGSGRQILFKAGFGKYMARLLTPRECARLMGADDFVIKVPLNQALFGFGDAVCVPVVEWIARRYLNPVFDEIKRASEGNSRGLAKY